MKKIELKEKIFSNENIYAAIYALKSYVYEPNLLNSDDYKLYCKLKDKYDKELIDHIIAKVQNRLEQAYAKNKLFDAKVYFKLKNYKAGRFNFRPIHTCDLITLICIVAILQPIMFYDGVERKYSDLSAQIPYNFYGNRPSTDIEHIYQKWQKGYKEYSDLIIARSKEYCENNKYANEVNLDLEDFFPSVNPIIIINYIKTKCQNIYSDTSFLESSLIKLLYFKLPAECLRGWVATYYPKLGKTKSKITSCTTRGIPQGLPQAPYFGNIIMMIIANILKKKIDGDALYYVDDSIIFTNLTRKEFAKIIENNNINKEVIEESGLREDELNTSPILERLEGKRKSLQKRITYKIRFHKTGKSYIRPIQESYKVNGNLSFLRRQVSMAGPIFGDSNEFEDASSLEKITRIREIIEFTLKQEKEYLKQLKDIPGARKKTTAYHNYANKIKLLRRHLKFFKFRELALRIRSQGRVFERDIKDFEKRLLPDRLDSKKAKEKYIETFDEDIFHAEYRFIVNNLPQASVDLEKFYEKVILFEEKLAPKRANAKYLYFRNDIEGCKNHRIHRDNSYDSLTGFFRENFGAIYRSPLPTKVKVLLDFIHNISHPKKKIIGKKIIMPDYTKFVSRSSPQFIRRIYNAACSCTFDVEPSDSLIICKHSDLQASYSAFRIIAYIRNKNCNLSDFTSFIEKLAAERNRIDDALPVDMPLTSILSTFVKYVGSSAYVDNLIQTHRKISSIWKNGSKFLNDYTLHNEDHAICLIRQCVHLCKTIDYLNLKHQDFYPLFLACYLHDISMVRHPDLYDFCKITPETVETVTSYLARHFNSFKTTFATHRAMLDAFHSIFNFFENKVRNNHARYSASYILNNADNVFTYIDKAMLSMVAEIGRAHCSDAESVYLEKSDARNALFSIKYMKIILRLADLMDMCSDRVSFYRMQDMLSAMSAESRFHWISHLFTENANLITEYSHPSGRVANKPINLHVLSEKIRINIKLNALPMIGYKNNNICSKCHLKDTSAHSQDESGVSSINHSIILCGNVIKDPKQYCPLACLWHMRKHKWLFNELSHLVSYLNDTNTRLFHTSFEINFYSTEENEIPSNMLEYIKDSLQKQE